MGFTSLLFPAPSFDGVITKDYKPNLICIPVNQNQQSIDNNYLPFLLY